MQIEVVVKFQVGSPAMYLRLWLRAEAADAPTLTWPARSLHDWDCAFLEEHALRALEQTGEPAHLAVDGLILHPVDTNSYSAQRAVQAVVAHLRSEPLPRWTRIWAPARPYRGRPVSPCVPTEET